jgi:hypothetical protein
MSDKHHSLILATEEEREWMIDRKMKIWFDWQEGEWKDMPKEWVKATNDEIMVMLLEEKRGLPRGGLEKRNLEFLEYMIDREVPERPFHPLLLATEKEREWMIDFEKNQWFDANKKEWKKIPKTWHNKTKSKIVRILWWRHTQAMRNKSFGYHPLERIIRVLRSPKGGKK